MNYQFFTSEDLSEVVFECWAVDAEEAFNIAYDSFGPQVEDWYYRSY
jgi:hypothetical protein